VIITSAYLLSGEYAPDPTYRNLYHYKTHSAFPPSSANETPFQFFATLRNADGTSAVPLYSVPFPENATICPIGETETGFTVELPTDDGFPPRPLYMIVVDSATGSPIYRYAFIEGYQRTAGQKIRCACRFDQWTEHYADIMAAEFTFSRRHQKRYVNRSAATKVKIYNGLSDPIAEGMVQGTSKTEPVVEIYGATKIIVPSDATGKTIIPIWLYWRSASNQYTYIIDGVSTATMMYGVDPFKSAVPVIATCLGIIVHDPTNDTAEFKPLWAVYKSDGTKLCDVGKVGGTHTEATTLAAAIATLRTGHPYIIQSWISTIPPFSCYIGYDPNDQSVPTVNRPTLRIIDDRFDSLRTPGDHKADDYYIGPVDAAAPLYVQNGTFLSVSFSGVDTFFPDGMRNAVTVQDNTTTTYDPDYEPKIEESPYEGKTLVLYGAEIDVSPTPANPAIVLSVEVGAHGDVILKSGSTEIYRSSGVCSQFGVDAATESITSWLVSNYATYQNAKLWKTINAGVGAGTAIIAGAATGNVAGVLGGGIRAATAIGETITGERARYADLASSPNATTLSSENAFDNFPFVDLLRIKKRTIPAGTKLKIMRYWHIYGYPDNTTGTIAEDATLRESFSFVQGAPVNVLPGVYQGEINDIMSALRSGAWLWKTHEGTDDHREWLYVDRQTPLLDIQNNEVI